VTEPPSLPAEGCRHEWSGVHVVVVGLGTSGYAAAEALAAVGGRVTALDDHDGPRQQERARLLHDRGATVRLGGSGDLPAATQLVVVSPGVPPTHRLVEQAGGAGVPVWSGEQLAWWLRTPDQHWLTVTGTNGKTTTVEMLGAMLAAAGLRCAVAGNVGRPLVEAATAEPGYEVLAVELSSFQLHFTTGLRPHSSALLNVADDHLDWHGSAPAYRADKARVFQGSQHAVVYNAEDGATERMAREADVAPGCRAVGFTLGAPEVGMLGVVGDTIVDRAFPPDRADDRNELAAVSLVRPPGRHNVANALAASALARSYGVPAAAVREGLAAYRPPGHRLQEVAVVGGVTYVDDSKATNAHAASVALQTYDRVVWIAGGLAKGGRFDALVSQHARRLRGAVLIGRDRGLLLAAMTRQAATVPVIEVDDGETDPMERAVRAAAGLARPGDVVLLAPACASMDQFVDYAARGEAFTSAVGRLAAEGTS
jgi:UDP-N-acetylmuramoylalanine--D-glutamate ligase